MEASTQAIIDTQEQLWSKKSLSERIIERQDAFEKNVERQEFVNRVKAMIEYARPDLSQCLDSSQTKGEKRGTKMYTSMPANAIERAADAFCGHVYVADGWFRYGLNVPELRENDAIQRWLQDCQDHMVQVYEQSNFYAVVPSVTMDTLSLGEGISFVGTDDSDRPYVTYCEFLNTWFIRNRWGRLIAVHRRHSISALEAYQRWGTNCSDELVRCATGNDPAKSYLFLQVVYQKDDPLLTGLSLKDEAKREFVEAWIQETSDKNKYALHSDLLAGVLEQGGYLTMPFMDWPYFWKSHETYGRAALHIVGVKRLHAECKAMMKTAQMAAEPPLLAGDSLLGRLNRQAGKTTWIKDGEFGKVEELFKKPLRYDFGVDMMDRQERQIQEELNLPLFMAMTMAEKELRVVEAMERIGERAAALRPRLGLLQGLYLEPIHQRFWQIEEAAGRLPPKPAELVEYAQSQVRAALATKRKSQGLAINVQYKGPLAQAQDVMFTQRRLAGAMLAIQIFQPIDPEAVADAIDAGIAIEEILDRMEFFQSAIRGAPERAQRQQMRAAVQMAQAGAEVEKTASEGIRNLAKARQAMPRQEVA